MKKIIILLIVSLLIFSCKPPKSAETKQTNNDSDVLRPPEGYNNQLVQHQEKAKDSLLELQNAAMKARPQPCVQVGKPTETGKTENTALFSWASTGVNKYYVYKNGIYDGTAMTTSYKATGLLPSVTYQFSVAGLGRGNKVCPLSLPLSITTLSGTTPPTSTGEQVVFLQFNADTIVNTQWNTNGPIISPGSGLTSDKQLNIFNHAKAIYAKDHPKISWTMERSIYDLADPTHRVKVVYTTNSAWFGSAGGVSFIGSFNTNQPCWVFTELENFSERNIGVADIHEIGHTLGLDHNVDTCTDSYGQARLCSDGLWRAPIMGGSYTDYEHYFFTPLKGLNWGIKGLSKFDCKSPDEDAIIEKHLK
jgi:hypothetical protein